MTRPDCKPLSIGILFLLPLLTALAVPAGAAPTEFDWRIGVLNGSLLYACRYFMARGHWQIYNWASRRRRDVSGQYETLAVADAPKAVVQMAVKAAGLMGDGFYGVDLKELDGKPVVIEINDNPSVESGVEDKVLGHALYDAVIAALRRRVEARRERDKP